MTPSHPVHFEREAELIAAEAARKAGQEQTAAVHKPGVPGVYGCIVRVSAELAKAGVAKDSRNVQQGYAFRGIDAVMNALAPSLAKHGLVILPRCLSRTVVEHPSKGGGTLFYVTVEAEFDFVCAADGSTHTVRMYGEAMDSADKATNKAMSAAYKYAAFQTFCIPTEGEDADETTPEIQQGHATGHAASDQIQAPSVTKHVATPPGAPSLPPPASARPALQPASEVRENTAEPPVGDRGSLPDGAVRIVRVDHTSTKNPNVTKHLLTTSTGETFSTIKDVFARAAEVYRQQATPVRVTGTKTKWGLELQTLERVEGSVFEADDEERVPF
jgi:ERF superfamily